MPLTLKNFNSTWGGWWQPWANTIAYYPLNWDLNDYSGNDRHLTWSWVTYTPWWPWQVASFSSSSTAYYTNQSLFNISYPFTYSFYIKSSNVPTTYYQTNLPYRMWAITITDGNTLWTFDKYAGLAAWWLYGYNYYGSSCATWWWTINNDTWYHCVYTFDGLKEKLYLNWSLVSEKNCWGSHTWYSNATFRLAHQIQSGDSIYFNWQLSNVIVENVAWSAQEVSDYFDITKSLYGIS